MPSRDPVGVGSQSKNLCFKAQQAEHLQQVLEGLKQSFSVASSQSSALNESLMLPEIPDLTMADGHSGEEQRWPCEGPMPVTSLNFE